MEGEQHPSGWTVETLRAYLESRITESDRRYEQRFLAQERAVDRAQIVNNEFRGTLEDQAQRLMPRAESTARWEATATRIERIEAHFAEQIDVVKTQYTQEIKTLTERMNLQAGKGAGLDAGWKLLVGLVTLAATILAIVAALR